MCSSRINISLSAIWTQMAFILQLCTEITVFIHTMLYAISLMVSQPSPRLQAAFDHLHTSDHNLKLVVNFNFNH